MARKTFTITLSILAVLFIIQHIYIKKPDILKQMTASENYSNVEINLLSGSFEPIGYYQGKEPVVLIFWAANSNPSKLFLEELKPKLDDWHEKDSFTLIAINVGDSKAVVEQTKELWGLNMKIGLDPDRKIAKDFGVGALPTVLFINKKGEIKKRWDNFGEDLTGQLSHYISAENKPRKPIDSLTNSGKEKVDTVIMDGDTIIHTRE